MALVFALRLWVYGLIFLLVFAGLFVIQLSQDREVEALLTLFAVFQLVISLVLMFVRFSSNLNRFLLLTPLVCLGFDQVWSFGVAAGVALLLVLEAMRRESRSVKREFDFGRCQAYFLMACTCVALCPRQYFAWIVAASLAVFIGLVILASWRWQRAIRQVLEDLDLDEETQS